MLLRDLILGGREIDCECSGLAVGVVDLEGGGVVNDEVWYLKILRSRVSWWGYHK